MTGKALRAILAGAMLTQKAIANLAQLAAFFGGLALIAGGVWLVSQPAGLIVGGVLLVATVVAYVRGATRR